MNARRKYFAIFLYLLFAIGLKAQENISELETGLTPSGAELDKYSRMNLSLFTGKPNPSIPIHVFDLRNFSYPIYLSYHSAIKSEQRSTEIGLGWSLSSNQMIQRNLRGYPDFYSISSEGHGYFTLKSDLIQSIDQAVQVDAHPVAVLSPDPGYYGLLGEYIHTGRVDISPDIFTFNFDGHSGTFVFDKNGDIIIESTNPLSIKPNHVDFDADEYPANFVVTTQQGIKYTFDAHYDVYFLGQGYHGSSNIVLQSLHNSLYFGRWLLREIDSGVDKIHFEYDYSYNLNDAISEVQGRWDKVTIQDQSNKSRNGGSTVKKYYEVVVSRIYTDKEELIYEYSSRLDSESRKLSKIIFKNVINGSTIKTYDFKQSYFEEENGGKRLKLDNFKIMSANGISKDKFYAFDYYSGVLPSIGSGSEDHWGYYNGTDVESAGSSLPLIDPYNNPKADELYSVNRQKWPYTGVSKVAVEAFTKIGVLNKIRYPTGVTVSIDYEQNTHSAHYSNISEFTDLGLRLKNKPFFYASAPELYTGDNGNISEENATISLWTKTGITQTYTFDNNIIQESHFDLSHYWIDEFQDGMPYFGSGPVKIKIEKPSGNDYIVVPDIRVNPNRYNGLHDYSFDEIGSYQISIIDPYQNYYSGLLDLYMKDEGQDLIGVIKFNFFSLSEEDSEDLLDENLFPKEAYSGGLRVKTVSEISDDSTPQVIEYNYDSEGISSGVLPCTPLYVEYHEGCLGPPDSQNETTEFGTMTNKSIITKENSEISYRKVSTTQNDGGKTDFYYSVHSGLGDDSEGLVLKVLSRRLTSYSYLNGVLDSVVYFKKVGEEYLKVKKEEYIYKFTNKLSDLIPYTYQSHRNWTECGLGSNHAYYLISSYRLNPSRKYLTNKKVTEYFYDIDNVQTKIAKEYKYSYRSEDAFDEDFHALYPISETCKSCSDLGENVVDYYQYDDFGNQTYEVVVVGDRIVSAQKMIYLETFGLLSKSYSFIISSPIYYSGNIFEFLETNVPFELEAEFTYDEHFNLTENINHRSKVNTAYVWSYNGQYMVAKVVNSRLDEVNSAVSNLSSGFMEDLYLSTSSTEIKSRLLELRDALSSHSSTVQVSTYLQKPSYGISEKTDSNGVTTYYEYDEFGRLYQVKDKDGNVLSENKYKYKH